MEIVLVRCAVRALTSIVILRIPGAGEMRVLVCGGGDFDDVGLMIGVLDRWLDPKSRQRARPGR